jgi:hypothetical protein
VLIQQTRDQEQENRAQLEQNSKLAGEQTNYQLRISRLNKEKAEAESRLAQWSKLINDLTNQIASMAQQKAELESRNHALTAVNRNLSVATLAPAVATNAVAATTNQSQPVAAKTADDKKPAVAENFPDNPPIYTALSDANNRRNLDILFLHGECLYSEGPLGFHTMETHRTLHEGAVVQTGKNSWCDLFIRRAGTLVRVGPETQMKIARLSQGAQNGFPTYDTLLVLPHGRLYTIARAMAPSSTVEIRDGIGRSVIEVGGLGDYMISAPTADDPSEKLTVTPLRVVSQNGTTLIAPGESYTAKDGSAFSLVPSAWEMNLIHLDDLELEADKALAEPLPRKQ